MQRVNEDDSLINRQLRRQDALQLRMIWQNIPSRNWSDDRPMHMANSMSLYPGSGYPNEDNQSHMYPFGKTISFG
jgi:hypothetical protein